MAGFEKYTDYKTVLSVNALIFCKDRVLLMKRADDKKVDPGVYSGVGGKVEPGEDFYAAILREVKEETGLEKFESMRPFSVTQHPYPPTNAEWVNLYFIVKVTEQTKVPPNKDGKFFWFKPEDAEKLPMVSDLKEYIKIISKNPKAFILGFFDHDKEGKLIRSSITVL